MVLRKGSFPLPVPEGKRIAVVGPFANVSQWLVGDYIQKVCPDGTDSCVSTIGASIAARNSHGKTDIVPGCASTGCKDPSNFAPAVEAARAADLVVLTAGDTIDTDHEGVDRRGIDLAGGQAQLVAAVLNATSQAGVPTLLLLNTGEALAIEAQLNGSHGIMATFYAGNQAAEGLADVLFGHDGRGNAVEDAAGKLPMTWYPSEYVSQIDPNEMRVAVPPGLTYRHYNGTPVFPFGAGQSLSSFDIARAGPIGADSVTVKDTLVAAKALRGLGLRDVVARVSVQLSNTGPRRASEVVMFYAEVAEGQQQH